MPSDSHHRSSSPGRTEIPSWLKAVVFGLAYFGCAEASRFASARDSIYVSFWLPAGLYVAALLLNPRRSWPWLILAALPANLAFDLRHGTPVFIITLFFLANTVQAVLGAWLITRFVMPRPTLATLKEFAGLLGFAGVSQMVGAAIGAGTLVRFGLSASFAQSWKVWWGSNAMAILVFTPFILAWFSQPLFSKFNGEPRELHSPKKIIEAVLLFLGLSSYLWYLLAYEQGIMSPNKSPAIAFLLWAGVRFGLRGGTAVSVFLALTLAFFTTQYFIGLNPAQVSSGSYVFSLQILFAMATLVALVPAIVIGERDRSVAWLRESEEHFRNLAAAAFEGIGISENGRVVDMNDPMLKMFGYERSEIIGREVIELVAPESRAEVAEAIRVGRESIYEHRLVRKDGSFFYAEARAKTARVNNRFLRMTALRDITDRKRAEEERAQTVIREQKAREEFSRHLLTAQERERTRLASELHDSLGQKLSIIKNRANLARQLPEGQPNTAVHLEAIERVVSDAIAETRNLAHNLRPPHIDQIGLTESLRGLIQDVSQSSEIRFERRLEKVDDIFSGETATNVYRIVQEALNNLIKHSHAKEAIITLERDVRTVRLRVADDGVGFDAQHAEPWRGLGLTSIGERARMLGGVLEIQSRVGRGTELKIELPIPEGSE